MKIILEINGYRSEIRRRDLGRALAWYAKADVRVRAFEIPESDLERREQRAKARKARADMVALMQARSWTKSKDKRWFKGEGTI